MARKKVNKAKEETDEENLIPAEDTTDEAEMNELSDDEEDAPEEVELSDIPIEQFLKDPKMSMITEEADVEETTAWCPVCNDYTIFVDKTCTVCGFVKGSKKSKDKDEEEESTESTFDLVPNEEVIDEMNMYGSGYDDEDKADY
jgi:hypothetical protein